MRLVKAAWVIEIEDVVNSIYYNTCSVYNCHDHAALCFALVMQGCDIIDILRQAT